MEEVYIEKIEEDAKIPEYAHETDAGMDVCAACDVIIAPGQTVIVKTGLKIALTKTDTEIQVRPRSGLSAKTKLRIANSPGTIDSGYKDEIGIIVYNESKDYTWDKNGNIKKLEYSKENIKHISESKNEDCFLEIKKGDKIAQLVFSKVIKANINTCEKLPNTTEDRKGGFGSTGV